jgi:hypothetical protein
MMLVNQLQPSENPLPLLTWPNRKRKARPRGTHNGQNSFNQSPMSHSVEQISASKAGKPADLPRKVASVSVSEVRIIKLSKVFAERLWAQSWKQFKIGAGVLIVVVLCVAALLLLTAILNWLGIGNDPSPFPR